MTKSDRERIRQQARANQAAKAMIAVPVQHGGERQIQTITTTGSPTGGTFTLTCGDVTTEAIPYNATDKE